MLFNVVSVPMSGLSQKCISHGLTLRMYPEIPLAAAAVVAGLQPYQDPVTTREEDKKTINEKGDKTRSGTNSLVAVLDS